MSKSTATILSLIAAFGCGTPRTPDAGVAPLLPTPVPVASVQPVSTAPVLSPPAPPNPLDDVKPACRGASLSFDTDESAADCRYPAKGADVLPSPPATDVEVTASVVEKSIAPGGTATVVVTTTNKSAEPLLLYIDQTCDDEPAFWIRVLDAKGKRVDYVSHKNCSANMFGCTRRVIRIVLEPGGSLRQKRSFMAKVTKLVADCGEVVAGSMGPGRYVLRVVTGFRDETDTRRRAEAILVVK